MPSYSKAPYPIQAPVILAVPGFPVYGFGSYDDKTSSTVLNVNNVSGNGTSVVLTGTVISGNVPTTTKNPLASTQGLTQITNVTNAAVTGVTINATTGVGTITITSAQTVSSVADSGIAVLPIAELGDTLANGASVPFTFQYSNANPGANSRSIKCVCSFPSSASITTLKVTLQSAITNQDAEYADLVTVASFTTGTLSGGQATVTLEPGRFYRFNVSSLSGTGTIIAKAIA